MSFYEDITGEKYVEPKKKKKYEQPDWLTQIQAENQAKKTNTKKNKLVKKSSYFEDGYDFGDVTKTILSTTGDLAANVTKGFMNTIEGTVDTARYAIGNATKNSAELQAKVWDFLGNESYASSLRKAGKDVKDYTYKNAQMNVTGALLGETNDLFQTNWSQKLNEGSAAGSLVNSVEQGIGNIGAFVGLSGIGGLAGKGAGVLGASTTTTNALTSLTSSNASTFVNSFTSAFGNSMSNALNSGLNEKEARGQAITSGLAEAISEQFFQGIPGLKSAGWADNLISKPIGKYFSGKTGKIALKAMDSVGEGLEEVISNVLQTTFEGIRTNKNVKDIFSELGDTIKSEETREAMISAFISSALTNGGGALITNNQKNQIIESYAQEHDMSVKETKQLFDSLVEKKANLEETSNYKERVDLEENISKQLVKDLKTDNKIDLNELFKQTPNSLKEMQFRFNQEEAKNVRTKKQNILANDMARLNDEKSNHELYKVVNAIQSANDTQQYHITTTEGLYEMGIVKKNNKGEYVMPDGSPYVPRGLNYKNGEIYINADVGSQSGTQAVYHEMFEGFKKAAPKQYNEFKQMVTDIIGEETIQKEFDTYKSMYGEKLTNDIRDEIINDKFGELAENQNFINRISDNRNVLEKFIDSIKNMIKYVKGTDEERQLMKLQKNLEKEFAKRYKETDFSKVEGETAYSLEQNINKLTPNGITMTYVRNPNTNTENYGDTYGQNLEPAGEYMNMDTMQGKNKIDGYEYGTIKFNNPLVIDNIDTTSKGWKKILSDRYNGLTGKKLSNAIKNDGYDAVMTRDEDGNIWEVVNLNGTKQNNDTRYSLSSTKDSQGRDLTPQQQEYFKDSKVVDENGNLLEVYHGTSSTFNVFDKSKIGANTNNEGLFGKGFYFTNNEDLAKGYSKYHEGDNHVKKGYLNITNPFVWKSIKTEEQMNQFIQDNNIPEGTITWNRYEQEIHTINEVENERAFSKALKEAGYDGIIYEYRQQDENHKAVQEIVAFESNQFKNVDNTNPTSNEDIRYSLSPTGEMVDNNGDKVEFEVSEVDTALPIRDENKLMVLHNLGENKMNGIMDLDGIPVPSLAVTNPYKVDHSGFGEATLIFKKDTINPENRLNEVYDRDIWSPTQPRIEYDLDNQVLRKMAEENHFDTESDGLLHSAKLHYLYSENLGDLVNSYGIESTLNRMKNDNELKYMYKKSTDKNYQPQMKPKKYNNEFSNKTLKEYINLYNDNKFNGMSLYDFWYHYLNYGDMQLTEDQEKALKATIRDFAYKQYKQDAQEEYARKVKENPSIKDSLTEEKYVDVITNMELEKFDKSYFLYKDFIRDASGLDKFGEQDVIDETATLKQVEQDTNQAEYEKWVDDTFGKMLRATKKGIRNDKELFTASGNRRSFDKLHEEYNLENLVKVLTNKDTVGGEEGFGSGSNFGTLQAKMGHRFDSIEDIRSYEDRISPTNNQDIEDLKNAIYDDMAELNNYKKYYSEYSYFDNAGYALNDYAEYKTQDLTNLKKALEKNDIDTTKVPTGLLNKVVNEINQLKTIPTDYFEAKPQRAVGLDEIGIGLIPNTWSEETKQRMRDKGIKFIEYDKSIEGERQRIEKELTDYMFSLTSNKNIDSKEVAPIGTTTDEMIAPIREDISNLSNQLNNLSNQIQTLQNQAEMTSDNEIAPVNPYRARAIAQREANQRAEEMYKDENYWKSLEEIANQVSDLDEKSARKMSRNIGKELGLKQKQIKDLQNIIQKAFDNGYSLQDIRNELDMEFGHQRVTEKLQEVIDAQKMIRDFKIKVSPEIQKDIADYGYWKQQYFGKIKFNNTGDTVGSVYQQLNEMNPAMFPSDIVNDTDQLMRIAEVADMDRKYSVDYEMNPETIDEAANYIHDTIQETLLSNAMKQQTDLEKNAMQYNERIGEIPVKKKTRQEVRENLQNTMGITTEDLQAGNDIKSMDFQLTTPERVNEKVFGREVGRKINEQTVFFAKHQEAERIRFLNKERAEIADLGIKARSKESALVQQYGEGLLDDVQLAQAVSDKATQEKIKNAARVLRSKYDTYLDQINEELVEMGYDPIPKRKDYMRHFQELTDKFSQAGIPFNRQDLNSENLPTDINGLTEFNVPGKNWFASAQRRIGEKTTYDAITGIDGYLEGASNLMYHTETIQRYRALEKLIRDTYGQQHGLDVFGDDLTSEQAMQRIQDIQDGKLSNYAAWLKEQGNAIAGKKAAIDRSWERFLGRKGYTFINTLKKQTGSNMTAFNVRTAFTNFISQTIAAAKTNKIAMAHGTIDTIQNIFHKDGFETDFLVSRFGSDSLSQKTWQKIANAGQIFMKGSDWFTSNVIVRSKYYEGIQKGMTDAQAKKYADNFAARVMGDRSKGATAEAFNSKTLGLFTQFQLETNNQWQYMIHDTKMEYQENMAKDGGLKAGAMVLFQMGQLAAYSYLFNELFESLTGSRAAFDPFDILKKLFGLDDDDKDKDFEERMKEAGSELVDALPFASLFGSGGRLPIGEMLTPVQTVYDYITGGTNKYGQDITLKDVKKDTLEALPYYILPAGYGQIKKTAQGLGMYANEVPGSYTDSGNLRFTADTDTGSVIKNALFGQWSGEEAKKYRESGYKTIRANDVQEMQDLGMKSSEYREYKNDLKEAGSKNADKLDYINSLNIPISQKNIMASNVVDRPVDMSDYTTYEEFDFAYKNPGKYQAMKAIANNYTDYQTYMTGIEEVRDKYSQNKGYSTEQRKAKVISYVNSLNLTIPQKAMLLRQYYSSYKRYNKEIVNYVSSLDIEYQEKVEILQSLKMKVDSNGNVSW